MLRRFSRILPLLFFALSPCFSADTAGSCFQQMEKSADLVVKGMGEGVDRSTVTLTVMQVLKGTPPAQRFQFLQPWIREGGAKESTDPPILVFARKIPATSGWEALYPTCFDSVLMAANDDSSHVSGVSAVVWHEWVMLTRSPQAGEKLYALQRLDLLSRPSKAHGPAEFNRASTLLVIIPFLENTDPFLQRVAIEAVGHDSPYMMESADLVSSYVSSQPFAPGFGRVLSNQSLSPQAATGAHARPEAADYALQLIRLANSKADSLTRALAIRALGLCRMPAIAKEIPGWLSNSDAQVRESAILVFADYASLHPRLSPLIQSRNLSIRQLAIRTAGRVHDVSALPALDAALSDGHPAVRGEAARALLGFPVSQTEAILRRHFNDPQMGAAFVNVVAATDPKKYRHALAHALRARVASGTAEAWQQREELRTSWQLLFGSLKTASSEELSSDALHADLDALEHAPTVDPSNVQNLYLFYKKSQLGSRAQQFRQSVVQSHPEWESLLAKIDQDCQSGAMVCDSSRVIGIHVASDSASHIDVDVDYYYSGAQGRENVRMECITLTDGASNGFWGFEPGYVWPGRNTTRVKLDVNNMSPDHYDSNELKCSLYVIESGAFAELTVPLKKHWTRRI